MAENTKLAELFANLQAQLEAEYHRGHKDGCAETRQQVLKAIGVSDMALGAERAAERLDQPPPAEPSRVERGAVRRAVQQVVAEHPGLTSAEIERRAVRVDTRIAPTSVANELNRNKGTRYRRRAGRWYLREDGVGLEDETAGTAEGDHPPHMNGAEASG